MNYLQNTNSRLQKDTIRGAWGKVRVWGKHVLPPTRLISPACGIALLAIWQHLLIRGEAGVGDLITGRYVSIQPDESNVKLHRRHSRILEALMAVDARDIEAALARLRKSQVVLAEAHAPTLQLISIPEKKGIDKSIILTGHNIGTIYYIISKIIL